MILIAQNFKLQPVPFSPRLQKYLIFSPYDTKKSLRKSEAFGAENETRTRDPNLGKVVLYQLSYFRITQMNCFVPFGIAKVSIIFNSPNFLATFL